MKDLGVLMDSKPLFFITMLDVHCLSHSERCDLHVIVTFCFSTIDCLLLLYYTLVRSRNIPHLSRITLRLVMPVNW